MVQVVTSEDFDTVVLQSDVPVLVDFYADWCGPCQGVMPVLEKTAESVEGAKVVKVNIDNAGDVAGKYGIMSIPAFRVFKNGEVVGEASGMQTEDQFKAMIDSAR